VLLEVEGHAAARLRVEELGALLRGPAGSVARVVVAKQPPPPRGAVPRLSSPPRLSSSAAALFSPPSSSAASASRPALLPMVPSVGAATANSKGAAAAASPPSPPRTLALELERRPIPQPPVKTAPLRSPRGRSVAYIRLHYFARDATRALAGALLAAEARGDEGVVLDLRNNPGGVFEEALADAAMFLRRGEKIASTTRTPAASPTSPPPPPMATFVAGDLDGEASPSFLRRAALSSAPMAVLVDAGSASGAEVLAGALRDSGRAVLVGPRRTFGKGLIQYYFLVDDERGGDGSGGDRRKNSSNDSGVGGGIKVTGKKKETSFILFFPSQTPPLSRLFLLFLFSPSRRTNKKKRSQHTICLAPSRRLLHAKGPRPFCREGARAAALVLRPRQRAAGKQLLGFFFFFLLRCCRGGRGRRVLARGSAVGGRRDRQGRRGRRRRGVGSLLKREKGGEREKTHKLTNIDSSTKKKNIIDCIGKNKSRQVEIALLPPRCVCPRGSHFVKKKTRKKRNSLLRLSLSPLHARGTSEKHSLTLCLRSLSHRRCASPSSGPRPPQRPTRAAPSGGR